MQISDILGRAARRYGDAPAILCEERTISFAELDESTNRLANGFLAAGLVAGDRVGVLLPNGIEGLFVYYALAKAGLVRVPLNVRDALDDHRFRLEHTTARALVSDDPSAPDVEVSITTEALARMIHDGSPEPCGFTWPLEQPFRIGWTGGTTGRSKGVMLSLHNEYAEISNYLLDYVPDLRFGDRFVHAAPVTHASGSFVLPSIIRGATNVIMTKFDTGKYLELLERVGATGTFLVPTMISMVLDDPGVTNVNTSALRRICYAASPIAPSVAERAQETFGQILTQTYGQAEVPMTISVLRPDEHDRVGSAGRPYTMVEVRVFDTDDREVAAGESGEVVVRGQIVFEGYWNQPDETAHVKRNGWLHTGDIGRFDDDGYLYLLDRQHDMIITGGFNVYPKEVEEALLAHPAVREAAVVSLADEQWGEVIVAVVSIREAVAKEALQDFVKSRLASYKRPRVIHIWDELPRSSAGKILRRSVRDTLRSGGATAPR